MENTLYFGDNLQIIWEYTTNNSIDLIYLDPPFNSKAKKLLKRLEKQLK